MCSSASKIAHSNWRHCFEYKKKVTAKNRVWIWYYYSTAGDALAGNAIYCPFTKTFFPFFWQNKTFYPGVSGAPVYLVSLCDYWLALQNYTWPLRGSTTLVSSSLRWAHVIYLVAQPNSAIRTARARWYQLAGRCRRRVDWEERPAWKQVWPKNGYVLSLCRHHLFGMTCRPSLRLSTAAHACQLLDGRTKIFPRIFISGFCQDQTSWTCMHARSRAKSTWNGGRMWMNMQIETAHVQQSSTMDQSSSDERWSSQRDSA
jgi:hypothetical protein